MKTTKSEKMRTGLKSNIDSRNTQSAMSYDIKAFDKEKDECNEKEDHLHVIDDIDYLENLDIGERKIYE